MWPRPARPAVGAAAARRPLLLPQPPCPGLAVLGVPLTVRQRAEAGRQQQHAEKAAHFEKVGVDWAHKGLG